MITELLETTKHFEKDLKKLKKVVDKSKMKC